ncbi:hypothetical protein OIU77_008568 [Salix suchowensis]|uniref:Vesicle transport protein n=1 Tax=Salix suchowensis TaxID=1278906 RepID=A0ABQ9ABB5_9ROSI|nr:hypothetical protein OIU77_008568 [Salix suchowensis]
MQSWFSSSGEDQQQEKPASSLLADWNSYAATSNSNESSTGLSSIGSFDLEAAVRSANDTVSGTFNVVSKGVSGNFQAATSNIPSGKALITCAPEVCYLFYTWLCLYHRVILCTQGSQESTCSHVIEKRLPFTLGFIGSMVGTLYVSMVLHSYFLSVSLLCDTGSCPRILRYFLLPRWIYWAEIHLIFPDLISDETFWELTLGAMLVFSLYISPFY